MFLRMPDTVVIPILCQNGVKVPVDRDDVIGVTESKLVD